MSNFGLIGVGGYIAPRHLRAIKETGNVLIAATDPNDSVGVLDQYFPEAKFFTEIERFDRFLEKSRRRSKDEKIDYISICSPNYLHDAHIRLALRVQAHAICEKPLTISPWNIDALAELEQEFGKKVYTIFQLRLLPSLKALKDELQSQPRREKAEIHLSYITRRGSWYHTSWKGQPEKSGGIAMNIGIHFFDLLLWLFGQPEHSELHLDRPNKMAGMLKLEWATVKWFLSIDQNDLPKEQVAKGKAAFRSITINGHELEFSEGFSDLHTESYKEILNGGGFGLNEARKSIDLVHSIRTSQVAAYPSEYHPILDI